MGKDSKIAWTHNTFNPWWGCVRVSEACRNCYAETWAKRTGFKVWGPTGARRFFGDKHWNQPMKWNRDAEKEGVRTRVFCASMCDVFEELPEGHPDAEKMDGARARLWMLIEATPNLDWLLLTKRPENINEMISPSWKLEGKLPDNVWAGTTAEDQETVDRRTAELAKVNAKVRFLSCEPLLSAIDLTKWLDVIDWVIVGGESGGGSREMFEAWARDIRDQADGSAVFFMKQMGAVWAKNNGLVWPNKGENMEDFPADLRIREFPG